MSGEASFERIIRWEYLYRASSSSGTSAAGGSFPRPSCRRAPPLSAPIIGWNAARPAPGPVEP